MRLLLDTHVFLWWWSDDRKLKRGARQVIERADSVSISTASTWEMAIKQSLGRLRFDGRFEDAIVACSFNELPIRSVHTEAIRVLPLHHTDPFDRMLIAQSLVEGLTLVSHDRRLEPYGAPILWA